MQFDVNRAFPYPVLRPGVDDYVDGEFQASVLFKPDDGDQISLEVVFGLSVEEIWDAVERGWASFVAVVSCRDTYFRRVFRTQNNNMKVVLSSGDLRGQVEVFPYVVVNKPIAKFSSKLINPEFGPGPFRFDQGTLLALEEPQAIYLDRDLFRPVSSVFELAKNENVSPGEWRLTLDGHKVQISLHPDMKARIDVFRNDTKGKATLLNSIYFSAVMQCLAALRRDGEYDAYRWAQIFKQQCHNHSIDYNAQDEYQAAQTLLKLPLALLGTYVFEGGS